METEADGVHLEFMSCLVFHAIILGPMQALLPSIARSTGLVLLRPCQKLIRNLSNFLQRNAITLH